MLTGLALFGVISCLGLEQGFNTVDDEIFNRMFQGVAILVSICMLAIGFNIFKKKILLVRAANGSAKGRMAHYRSACIMWWAMIEGPGLVAFTGYLLTANLSFFILGILHILILLFFYPRKDNIIVLLHLNPEEVSQLEGNH